MKSRQTCHRAVSPKNYAILLFAYLLSLPYLVALHFNLSLNSGIVTLNGVFVFGHPSTYEPHGTGLNFAERTTGVKKHYTNFNSLLSPSLGPITS